MKTLFLTFALFSLFNILRADPIEVAKTGITFEAPEGFEPLAKEIIALKWPANRAPAYAVGNESASTTVAYDLKPNNIPQKDLPAVKKSFTKFFERMIPGLQWKKNKIVEISGQNWILMEMTTDAIDTDIYNIMLVTGYKGKMLLFNFNSTKEDFPKYEAKLRKSLRSIKLPKEVVEKAE